MKEALSHRFAPALVAALLAACGGEDAGPEAAASAPVAGSPWFEEVAAEVGIDFVHARSAELRFWIPETTSGGAAWLDHDGDGRLDAFFVQGGDPVPGHVRQETNRLFRNVGDGTFRDVTDHAGVAGSGYGFGCAAGDYDGDGDVDLYVCNLEGNQLFRNAGDGTFEEVAASVGVREERWSAAATFLDYDADGDLDLFVANYLGWAPEREIPCKTSYGERDYCNPVNYDAPTSDTLYRNEGDGTFSDVSVASGIASSTGTGLGCVAADFDADGNLDVYVTNDGMPNHLWLGDGAGHFREEAVLAGCAVNSNGAPEAGMGVQAFDADEDGDWDLFMTHVREQTNTYYANSKGVFTDRTDATGTSHASLQYTGFGVGFHDFDLDGQLDSFVANGRVGLWRPTFRADDPFAEPNQLFRGLGQARFEELDGWLAGEPLLDTSRAAAFADYDDDGDIDVLYVDSNAPARLLRNVAARRGAWIGLRLVDERGTDQLGAVVALEAEGRTRYRLCQTSYSYAAANDPRVHFGLGPKGVAERVVVTWPAGARELFGPLEPGRYHMLRVGAGRPVAE